MRVLVLWADDKSSNLGVRVLSAGTAELARRAWGDPTISTQDFAPNENGFGLGGRNVLADILRRRGPVRAFLSEFDMILDTGAGDSFADIYGLKRLAIMIYVQRSAQRLGIPIVQTPQTIGPFRTRVGRLAALRSMRRMKAVMSRDSVSTNYAESLGVAQTVQSTDVVFALQTTRQPKIRDVVLNVSGLLWNENSHVDHLQYRASLVDLVAALRGEGRIVSLLAHVLDNGTNDNDVPAVRALALAVGGEIEEIHPSDLSSARDILAGANLVIGSRMHACLNALSVGTPAIPWAYSRKFEPLMRDIGWRHVIDLTSQSQPVVATIDVIRSVSPQQMALAVGQTLSRTEHHLDVAVSTLRSATLGDPRG